MYHFTIEQWFAMIFRYIFETFDTDHNQSISFEEFLVAISPRSQIKFENRAKISLELLIN